MPSKETTVIELIRSNLWQIIIMIVGGIIVISSVKQEVRANAQEIKEIKEFQLEYPSKDWFELKFNNVDEKFISLEKKIDNHLDDIRE